MEGMKKSKKEFESMVAARYRDLEETAFRIRMMNLIKSGAIKLDDNEEAEKGAEKVQEREDNRE